MINVIMYETATNKKILSNEDTFIGSGFSSVNFNRNSDRNLRQ